MSEPSIIELAWAAGFYDGEGCTYVKVTSNGTKRPIVRVCQRDPQVLQRFVDVVGEGKVLGPYKDKHGQRWVVQVGGPRATRVIAQLWPYLSPVKRQQALEKGAIALE